MLGVCTEKVSKTGEEGTKRQTELQNRRVEKPGAKAGVLLPSKVTTVVIPIGIRLTISGDDPRKKLNSKTLKIEEKRGR